MIDVVVLHGFCGSAETFADVQAGLGPAYRCHAPALLGHGASEVTPRFEGEVDRLARVIVTPTAPLLLGYSFGGRLAMGLVARHPQRWSGAIFVGAHPGLDEPDERAARRHADQRWIDLLDRGDLGAFIGAWEAQPIFASQAAVAPVRRARQHAERLRHDPQALSHAMMVLGLGVMPRWTEGLARARIPMVFLAGERDAKYVAVGERLAAAVDTLRLVVVPGVGHNVVLEAPAAVVATVRAMCEGQGA